MEKRLSPYPLRLPASLEAAVAQIGREGGTSINSARDDLDVMKEVYFDYNGSAPLDPRVAEVMVPILTKGTGNASSMHCFGRQQRAAVDEAREYVAAMVGGQPSNVVFTAGATEANNLALQGAVEGTSADRPRILISAVEHASVSQTARWLDEQGLAKLEVIPVTSGLCRSRCVGVTYRH